MAFPPLGNSYDLVVSVSIDFPSNSKWDALFHCGAYDCSCADWDGLPDHLRDVLRADWDGLLDHLRDVPREDIFKLSAVAGVVEFWWWFQVGIDVYVPQLKYQVKLHSSPLISCLCCCHSL